MATELTAVRGEELSSESEVFILSTAKQSDNCEESKIRAAPLLPWKGVWSKWETFGFVMGPLSFFIVIWIEMSEEFPKANDCLAITFWCMFWWIFEVIPLSITSFLPLILFPMLGIERGRTIANVYLNNVSFLFLGAFTVDIAIEKVLVHKRIAINFLLMFGLKPARVIAGFIIISGIISMFCSNTSTTIMLLPVAIGIVESAGHQIDREAKLILEKAVLFAVAHGATMGGISTTIGTAPNGVFFGNIDESYPDNPSIEFQIWFGFAFPIFVVMAIVLWCLLMIKYGRHLNIELDSNFLQNELKEMGPMARDEWATGLVLLFQVTLWVIRPYAIDPWVGACSEADYDNESDCVDHEGKWTAYADDGVMACLSACLLFLIPSDKFFRKVDGVEVQEMILNKKDFLKLAWDIIILFGAGFAIADGFKQSGLSDIVGEELGNFVSLGNYGLVQMITIVVVMLTELTSNTATASIIIPTVLSVANEKHIHPYLMSLPVTIGCSMAWMTPIATPPNMVIFVTGKITFREMMKTGVWLNIASMVLIPIAIFSTGHIFGDISKFPDWAKETVP